MQKIKQFGTGGIYILLRTISYLFHYSLCINFYSKDMKCVHMTGSYTDVTFTWHKRHYSKKYYVMNVQYHVQNNIEVGITKLIFFTIFFLTTRNRVYFGKINQQTLNYHLLHSILLTNKQILRVQQIALCRKVLMSQ